MKKVVQILLLWSGLLLLGGCKKEDLPFLKPNLKGSWELRHVEGVFWGQAPSVAPGNGNILKFSGSSYEIYTNGELSRSGTYTITKMDTYDGAYPVNALVLDGHTDGTARFRIKRNTLTIYEGSLATDGSIATYERQ